MPARSLVDTAWLQEHLADRDLAIVDMRWREDGSGRSLYEAGHIPGAVYLDWSRDIVHPDDPVAFMLAPPDRFAAVIGALGIGDSTEVVAYADHQGSGPFRLRWSFRLYGHDTVRILDGGMDRWRAEARPLTGDPVERPPARWTPRRGEPLAATASDVEAARDDPAVAVLDSRAASQFRGEFVWFETGPVPAGADGIARTPRGEVRAGRVPWAASVPFARLYRPDLTMRSPEELRGMLAEAGVPEGASRAITYCGVGLSASALLFALERAGFEDVRLYDASWEEWGRSDRPIARG